MVGRIQNWSFSLRLAIVRTLLKLLSEENSDTGAYSWDESDTNDSISSVNSQSSAASAVPVASASMSSDNLCDVCWVKALEQHVRLCLFLVVIVFSAIHVHVNCLLLRRNVASVDIKST